MKMPPFNLWKPPPKSFSLFGDSYGPQKEKFLGIFYNSCPLCVDSLVYFRPEQNFLKRFSFKEKHPKKNTHKPNYLHKGLGKKKIF